MSPGLAIFIVLVVYGTLLLIAGVFLPFYGLVIVIFAPAVLGTLYYVYIIIRRKNSD